MQKYLQGVVNGVESEGPQSRDGSREALPETNVVRLEDWIGPCDELVPFGRRRPAPEAERASDEDTPAALATPDPPPSAEDFWGERAAAVHDAVQAPAADRGPGHRATSRNRHSRHSVRLAGGLLARRLSGPAARSKRLHLGRRRALVAGALGLAAVGLALAVNAVTAGSPPRAGKPNAQVASGLTDEMARILRLDLPLIQPRPARVHAAVQRRSIRVVRRASHLRNVSEPVHHSTQTPTTLAVSSQSPVDADTARVAPATPPPSETTETTRSSPPTSTASSAAVSPTGESGALGPIQSPNG